MSKRNGYYVTYTEEVANKIFEKPALLEVLKVCSTISETLDFLNGYSGVESALVINVYENDTLLYKYTSEELRDIDERCQIVTKSHKKTYDI